LQQGRIVSSSFKKGCVSDLNASKNRRSKRAFVLYFRTAKAPLSCSLHSLLHPPDTVKASPAKAGSSRDLVDIYSLDSNQHDCSFSYYQSRQLQIRRRSKSRPKHKQFSAVYTLNTQPSVQPSDPRTSRYSVRQAIPGSEIVTEPGYPLPHNLVYSRLFDFRPNVHSDSLATPIELSATQAENR
jgi:hypothetical protein